MPSNTSKFVLSPKINPLCRNNPGSLPTRLFTEKLRHPRLEAAALSLDHPLHHRCLSLPCASDVRPAPRSLPLPARRLQLPTVWLGDLLGLQSRWSVDGQRLLRVLCVINMHSLPTMHASDHPPEVCSGKGKAQPSVLLYAATRDRLWLSQAQSSPELRSTSR